MRKLHRRIDCIKCNDAMVDVNLSNVHSLISEKDRGGLIYPSRDIIFIVSISERFFKSYVSGEHFLNPKVSWLKRLRLKITNSIILELSDKVLFKDMLEHDIESHEPFDDLHSTQIKKAVIFEFLNLRLYRYGQEYTKTVLMKGTIGKRQQLNQLLLFKGL